MATMEINVMAMQLQRAHFLPIHTIPGATAVKHVLHVFQGNVFIFLYIIT